MDSTFAHPVDEVLAHFGTNATDGLTEAQVQDLREKHGRNCKKMRSTCKTLLPDFICVVANILRI
jgi:hypothetical protein